MYKILKIIAAILGLVGIIFLIRIISVGDEAIKAGDDGSVDPIAYVAYIVLGITLIFVLYFVLKNLFTSGSLKRTLMGVGAFAAVLVIGYAVSGGDTTVYKYNNEVASSRESQMVGAGLVSFYILIVAAAAAMILSGIKKMFK